MPSLYCNTDIIDTNLGVKLSNLSSKNKVLIKREYWLLETFGKPPVTSGNNELYISRVSLVNDGGLRFGKTQKFKLQRCSHIDWAGSDDDMKMHFKTHYNISYGKRYKSNYGEGQEGDYYVVVYRLIGNHLRLLWAHQFLNYVVIH
uniref:Uncharacterized protein n=1 Tax=Solanum lycopersicum TaxID=4081 RepID=A0A3Q7J5E8_SOLLC